MEVLLAPVLAIRLHQPVVMRTTRTTGLARLVHVRDRPTRSETSKAFLRKFYPEIGISGSGGFGYVTINFDIRRKKMI